MHGVSNLDSKMRGPKLSLNTDALPTALLAPSVRRRLVLRVLEAFGERFSLADRMNATKWSLTTYLTYVGRGCPAQVSNSSDNNEKMPMARRLLTMLTRQGGVAGFQTNDKDVDGMLEGRKERPPTYPVHLG